jgi:lipoprotein NlpD
MIIGMQRYFRIALAVVPATLPLLLAACASTGRAPVDDLSIGAHERTPSVARSESGSLSQAGRSYRVQHGDTLYSIAFRHGVDYRELAGWNHIAAPYTIYVGQELRVAATTRTSTPVTTPASTTRATAAASAPAATRASTPDVPTPEPFETVTAQSASTSVPNPPAPASASPASANTAAAVAPVAVAEPATKPPVSVPPAITAPSPPPPSVATSGEIAWRWPAAGPVVGNYVAGDPTRQGIDIAGKSGDPVRAAADGTVVYSGNGLIGYGELIIVKHSPAFLSAYGHNRKRLVKEGDRVSADETIAEMGSSSANRDSLHFEIRKNGKPANPTDYLPRR